MEENIFIVEKENEGIRIDKYLFDILEDKSRSYIQRLVEEEKVLVKGKSIKSNYKVKEGDTIKVIIQDPVELCIKAEEIPLDILYEDSDVIVINKKQGMVVHPATGVYTGTLVNALLSHCKDLSGINGVVRPGIVHRIDKDTSGVLVIAKNDNSHKALAEQFKVHSIKREYYALVEGIVKKDSGIIDTIIGRHPVDRIKFAVVKEGKRAVTHYEVLERYERHTLVKCNLETGRTHQIRVHMAYIGHPLVGDPVYGHKKQRFKVNGQMLHAKSLGFIHPTKKIYMEFNSELPGYFTNILNILRNYL
ncbi:RluA family pseudouridine synthase [Clostridium sp. MSJ-4]|uniref:Pseudouridine synthase n=1 Tax=Clostridium simiarum TaxID=2841506 RepID=A0ABS6EX17_9CLOT|nr:RluA family pseudouridine synthase [Clostridium simiarum]MBU5590779.1 RluA family pseudouridine synthase [Clostridium simiarum]